MTPSRVERFWASRSDELSMKEAHHEVTIRFLRLIKIAVTLLTDDKNGLNDADRIPQ